MTKKKNKMLIVDDAESNRAILKEIFKNDYEIIEASDGFEAIEKLGKNPDVSIILLDLIMNGMDGFEVMENLSKDSVLSKIPVIIITSDSSETNESYILGLGASDVIRKPFSESVVRRRVENVVTSNGYYKELEAMASELTKKLNDAHREITDTFISIIEQRKMESGRKIWKIRLMTKILLEEASCAGSERSFDSETIELISEAASLYDVGKIFIPDSIILKPARLTEEEFEKVKEHTVEGCNILGSFSNVYKSDFMNYAYNICRHHHERWDGNGYPDGLMKDEIPFCAQVVGLVDAYDALMTEKVYKPAYTHKEAVDMIISGQCGKFSDELIGCFKKADSLFEQISSEVVPDKYAAKNTPKLFKASESVDEQLYHFDRYRYNTALKIIDGLVFEIDLVTGDYKIVAYRDEYFGDIPDTGTVKLLEEYAIKKFIYKDDVKHALMRFYLLEQDIASGKQVNSMDFYRIYNKLSEQHEWCIVRYVRIDLDNQRFRRVLLSIENINNIPSLVEEAEMACIGRKSHGNVNTIAQADAIWHS